jgi:hypothetical protein
MTSDELFLRTLQDLETLLAQPDEYALLRAAALLRQLLLDGGKSLVNKVNRNHDKKLAFVVTDNNAYVEMLLADGAMFYSTEDGLDPNTSPFGQARQLTRDQFLKWPVMIVHRHFVTVHDVIDQLAHIEGGVHAGKAKTEKQQALKEAAGVFGIGGLPAGTRMLAPIGRVTLAGLGELREAVSP